MSNTIYARDPAGNPIEVQADATGKLIISGALPGLDIPAHDTINLDYTDGNLTEVEYVSGGNVVETLTLTYTGGNLTSITKS